MSVEGRALIGNTVTCGSSPFCCFLRSPLGTWQRGGSSVPSSSVRTSSGSWRPFIQNCTCLKTGLASSGWWVRWARGKQGDRGPPGLINKPWARKALSWELLASLTLIPLPLFIHCASFSPRVSGVQVQNVSPGSPVSKLASVSLPFYRWGNWSSLGISMS